MVCPKCKHNGAHFVPPMFGDKGFFACDSFCDECKINKVNFEQETNMDVVQFGGKFYHRECFDNFLQTQKSQNRITSDYTPNVKSVEEDDLEDDDVCEGCAGVFTKEDETPPKKADDEDDDKKDTVVDTPSPTYDPRRRRR